MSFPTNTSSRSNDELAKILWDYNYLKQELKKSDAILVLGTKDTAVAEHGADLFLQGFAPYLIVTGGLGRLTKETFSRPEAEIFAEIAVKKGVPEKQILIENASTNTGENISFTKKLLEQRGLKMHSMIAVQKPYMLRRAFATLLKQWPEIKFIISAQNISFEEYCLNRDKDEVINGIVGDTQRVIEYPAVGYTVQQEVSVEVKDTLQELITRGFTKQLIKLN